MWVVLLRVSLAASLIAPQLTFLLLLQVFFEVSQGLNGDMFEHFTTLKKTKVDEKDQPYPDSGIPITGPAVAVAEPKDGDDLEELLFLPWGAKKPCIVRLS